MKIEKGKLYLDKESRELFKADITTDNYNNFASDKISVHCWNEQDWNYVKKQGYELTWFVGSGKYSLKGDRHHDYKHQYISIDEFKKFYPEEPKELSLPI